MPFTASTWISVVVSSLQQLFCTQQPPLTSQHLLPPCTFNHHRFSIKRCRKSWQRERERERKEVGERDKWHSSALTSWSLWSDCGRYILESLLFPWRQNENKLSADKNEKVTLKPSQSAWGVFLLSDRLFGKTDKHWTYCLTVCLSVCLSVSLSVSVSARLSVRLSGMPESYIETWLIWPTVALVSISVPDHPPLIITVWLIRSGQTFSM